MINSRKKGINYELYVSKKYKEIGFENVETSRYANKKRDDEKVDLVGTDPFNVQCKNYKNFGVGQAIEVLKQMPKDGNINIIHCKITHKGRVVIISENDWYDIVKALGK